MQSAPGQFQIKCLTYSLAWHAIDDSKISIYIYIYNLALPRDTNSDHNSYHKKKHKKNQVVVPNMTFISPY